MPEEIYQKEPEKSQSSEDAKAEMPKDIYQKEPEQPQSNEDAKMVNKTKKRMREVVQSTEPKSPRSSKEKMPPNSIRFNGLKHDIDFDETKKGFRCKLEGCGLPTTVHCLTCKVHLCFVTGKNGRNCFKRFHNLNEC